MNKEKKKELISFLISESILGFSDYKTNSGRISPYYLNLGSLDSAKKLGLVAKYYALAIAGNFPNCFHIFGPSYKGVSLAVASAQELATQSFGDVHFTFNRKEKKDHGEGGDLVGYQYQGGENVVVVEDVITSGKSLEQSFELLHSYKVNIIGVVVAVDRQEKFSQGLSAKNELFRKFSVPVISLLDIDDLTNFLFSKKKLQELSKMKNYIDKFCVR
jgi:orotate phosphoribosyltransferase